MLYALLAVVVLFVWVTAWGITEIRKVLTILTRHEIARRNVQLEEFRANDTEFVTKFNRNFERIMIALRGEPVVEHVWGAVNKDEKGKPIKRPYRGCINCGMDRDIFYKSHAFLECKEE